ncbi:hypothetical protein CFOL_v3_24823 [Cephalotus follicularis]|uniref:Uncharacterized protein n=1 Tax=Cephalotus follicularis TaxID=3775 RepID=A0A1Q3CM78_CEPFO|nr:hypothetical protein CFOL_v3_24823 [Cephalotus follicularis]
MYTRLILFFILYYIIPVALTNPQINIPHSFSFSFFFPHSLVLSLNHPHQNLAFSNPISFSWLTLNQIPSKLNNPQKIKPHNRMILQRGSTNTQMQPTQHSFMSFTKQRPKDHPKAQRHPPDLNRAKF